ALIPRHDGVAVLRGIGSNGLGNGAVENGTLAFVDRPRLGVFDDADDLIGTAGSIADMAARIFSLVDPTDTLIVDDSYSGADGVLFAEVASGDTRDAEGFEVVGPGHVELDDILSLRLGASGDLEAVAAVSHGERDAVGGRRGDCAGKRCNALARGADELH